MLPEAGGRRRSTRGGVLLRHNNKDASTGAITVRGLGGDDLAALKQAAEREGISMNRLALDPTPTWASSAVSRPLWS
ncbi:MAG: hypothetical protein VKM01_06330 [Cyanobacteriota bacterium]|jgi:hypothetical protein|nr:hypothetical protein [Cyanobacteriota bacterium]